MAARPKRASRATRGAKPAAAPRVGYSQRSRVDKLGVKPGMRVALLGIEDEFIRGELAERTGDVSEGRAKTGTAMILFGIAALPDLRRLATLQKSIARDGAIWAVWRKGRPELKEDHIRAAAIACGLVDIKVMAFSETLSGLKLVIPVAKR
jgi:hypothetical protein